MREYINKVNNVGDNVEGADTINAGEANSLMKELQNLVLSSDQIINPINPETGEDITTTQVASSIPILSTSGQFFNIQGGSTANAKVLACQLSSIKFLQDLVAGFTIKFINDVTNTGAVSIALPEINSNSYPLVSSNGDPLPSGTLGGNIIYTAVYDGTSFRVDSIVSPFFVGAGMMWYTNIAPAGWLLCRGQSISRITYPKLFSILGTQYGGSGDNFNLPDLQNRVPRGVGSLINLASKQEDQNKAHNHPMGHTHGLNEVAFNFDIMKMESASQTQDIMQNISGQLRYIGQGPSTFRMARNGGSTFQRMRFSTHYDNRLTFTNASSSANTGNQGNAEGTVKGLGINFIIKADF